MTNATGTGRVDSASRIMTASPQTIYQALLDPLAVAKWRPPKGMKAEIFAFEPREGGTFRMALTYTDTDHAAPGKSSEHADVVQGRFLKLTPNERVVEQVEFESDDPDFAGAMTITTILTAVSGGTKVTLLCENVPPGIRPSDHEAGMTSTLENLAAFTQGDALL
jgi:uncharacterized protein YndB with AHSA1/START domain